MPLKPLTCAHTPTSHVIDGMIRIGRIGLMVDVLAPLITPPQVVDVSAGPVSYGPLASASGRVAPVALPRIMVRGLGDLLRPALLAAV